MMRPAFHDTGGVGSPSDTAPARGGGATSRFAALRIAYGVERTPVEAAISLIKQIVPIVLLEYADPRGDAQSDTADLSPSAGAYVPIFTTPGDERWIIRRWRHVLLNASSNVAVTINGVLTAISVAGTAEATVPEDFQMEPADSIGMLTTGNAGDSAVGFAMLLTRYRIR